MKCIGRTYLPTAIDCTLHLYHIYQCPCSLTARQLHVEPHSYANFEATIRAITNSPLHTDVSPPLTASRRWSPLIASDGQSSLSTTAAAATQESFTPWSRTYLNSSVLPLTASLKLPRPGCVALYHEPCRAILVDYRPCISPIERRLLLLPGAPNSNPSLCFLLLIAILILVLC